MRWKYKFTVAALLLVAFTLTVYYIYTEKEEMDRLHNVRQRRLSYVTRDRRRRVTYNYPTSCNTTTTMLRPMRVDLSSGIIPNNTMLDRQLVIVMGFGSRRMYKGMGSVASVQSHMPFKKIIVYDLGIHPKMVKKLKQMCNTEVRKVPYYKYPNHVKKTENHAWLVLELKSILNEYGAVLYAEPDMRLRAPVSMLLPHIIKHKGILTELDTTNHTLEVTHPGLFQALKIPRTDFDKKFPNAPMASRFIAVVNSTALQKSIWDPMVECALNWKCIAPYGSERGAVVPTKQSHTHRYEFSLLTVLLHHAFGESWRPSNSTLQMIDKLYDLVDPDFSHDYLWAHFCNPPQNEIDCSVNEKKCS